MLECSGNANSCPGSAITANCPTPICEFGANELGACGCEEQFFVNSDCTEGFWCSSNNPNPYEYDGCKQTCNDNEILIPDVANHRWLCVDNGDGERVCPGSYNMRCPGDEVVPEQSQCDVGCPGSDGRLLVAPDCRSAFFCSSRMANGGRLIECPEQQILSLDIRKFSWGCQLDEGQCPGLGGFTLGCGSGAPVVTNPEPSCQYANNDIGVCDGCEGQLFGNADCTVGFYCHTNADNPLSEGMDGCRRECEEGQILVPDLIERTWTCISNWNGAQFCPGAYRTECDEVLPIGEDFDESQCDCGGQVFVSSDCRRGFQCGFPGNPGQDISCSEGTVFDFNLRTFSYECVDGSCPANWGGFKLGCQGETIAPPYVETSVNDIPFGDFTCECDKQVFISDDCSQAFVCPDTSDPQADSSIGYLQNCRDNKKLIPYFNHGDVEWLCAEAADHVCPGEVKVHCPTSDDEVVIDAVNCACDSQILINSDCSMGMLCLSTGSGSFQGLTYPCFIDEILSLDFKNLGITCKGDDGTCPGGGGVSIGCSPNSIKVPTACVNNPYAHFESQNPFGKACECENQLHVEPGCRSGFFCTTEGSQEGCAIVSTQDVAHAVL